MDKGHCFCGPQNMYPQEGKPATVVTVHDAPCGGEVWQTTSHAWLISQRFPLDEDATYTIRGCTRWLGNGDPGVYFATVYAFDYKGNIIGQDGAYYWYMESGRPKNREWMKHKGVWGPNGTREHHPNAKYFSIGIGMNYQHGTGTYQTCGWTVSVEY